MIPLPALFICDEQQALNQLDMNACLAIMRCDERERLRRYRQPEDQQRFLITRVLIREILSQARPEIAPDQWVFRTNAHGRPFIANQLERPLFFNLSHTPGKSVLLVSDREGGGIDVEFGKRQPHFDPLRLATRFFSQTEADDLLQLPPEKRPERFIHLWTLKEAYIKACSKGLAIPLTHFSFSFPKPGRIRVSFAPERNDREDRWYFRLYQTADNYVIGLALERTCGQVPKLRVLNHIPFGESSIASLTCLGHL